MKDLKTKIEIILNEEKRSQRLKNELGSFNINLSYGWTKRGEVRPSLAAVSNRNVISSPNAELLIKLFHASTKEQQKEFKDILISEISSKSDNWQISYLIFFVLYRIGELLDALKKAKLVFNNNIALDRVFGILSKIIYFEYSFIDEETYVQLSTILADENSYELKDKINTAQFKIIERELEGFNQEINEDKDKVINIWQEKFKTRSVPLVINEIEENFGSGEFNESKYATSIDRVRALIGEVTRGLAIEASQSKNDNKINKETKEHDVFSYLKEVGLLDLKEFNLLNAIYGMASDKGSHQVIAFREHARLMKNMTYEFILLLLNK